MWMLNDLSSSIFRNYLNSKTLIQLLVIFGLSLGNQEVIFYFKWIFQLPNKYKTDASFSLCLSVLQEFFELIEHMVLTNLKFCLTGFLENFEIFIARLPSIKQFIAQILFIYQHAGLYSLNIHKWLLNMFCWSSLESTAIIPIKDHIEKVQKKFFIKPDLIINFITDRFKSLLKEFKPIESCNSIILFLEAFENSIVHDANFRLLMDEWLVVTRLVRLNMHVDLIYKWDVHSNMVIESIIKVNSNGIRPLKNACWKSILDLMNFQLFSSESVVYTTRLLCLLRSHFSIISAVRSFDISASNECLVYQNTIFAFQNYPDSRVFQVVTSIFTQFADYMGLFFCSQIQNCLTELHNPLLTPLIISSLIALRNIKNPQIASDCFISFLGFFPYNLASASITFQETWCFTLERLSEVSPVSLIQWFECDSVWKLLDPDGSLLPVPQKSNISINFQYFKAVVDATGRDILSPPAIASLLRSTETILSSSISSTITPDAFVTKWYLSKKKEKISLKFTHLLNIAMFWIFSDYTAVSISASHLICSIFARHAFFEYFNLPINYPVVHVFWNLIISNALLHHTESTIRDNLLKTIYIINRTPSTSIIFQSNAWKSIFSQVVKLQSNPNFQKIDFRDTLFHMLPSCSSLDFGNTLKLVNNSNRLVDVDSTPRPSHSSLYRVSTYSKPSNTAYYLKKSAILHNSDLIYKVALLLSSSSRLNCILPLMRHNVLARQMWGTIESTLFFTSENINPKLTFFKDTFYLIEKILLNFKTAAFVSDRQSMLQWLFWMRKVFGAVTNGSISFSVACNEQTILFFILNKQLLANYLHRIDLTAFQIAVAGCCLFDIVECGSRQLSILLKGQVKFTSSQWSQFTEELTFMLVSLVDALIDLQDSDYILGLNSVVTNSLRTIGGGALPISLTCCNWMLAAHHHASGAFHLAENLYHSVLESFNQSNNLLTPQDLNCQQFARHRAAQCSLILGHWDSLDLAVTYSESPTVQANLTYSAALKNLSINLAHPESPTGDLQATLSQLAYCELCLVDAGIGKMSTVSQPQKSAMELLASSISDAITFSSSCHFSYLLSAAHLIDFYQKFDSNSEEFDFLNCDARLLIRALHTSRLLKPLKSSSFDKKLLLLVSKFRKLDLPDLALKILSEFVSPSLLAKSQKVKILCQKSLFEEASKIIWEDINEFNLTPKNEDRRPLLQMASKLPCKMLSDEQITKFTIFAQTSCEWASEDSKSWKLFADVNYSLASRIIKRLLLGKNFEFHQFSADFWSDIPVEYCDAVKTLAFSFLKSIITQSIDSETQFSNLEIEILKLVNNDLNTAEIATSKAKIWLSKMESDIWDIFSSSIRGYCKYLNFQSSSNKLCIEVTLRLLRLLTKYGSKLSLPKLEFDKIPARFLSEIFPQIIARLGHPDAFVKSCLFAFIGKVIKFDPNAAVFPLLVRCSLSSQALPDQDEALVKLKSEFTSVNADLVDQVESFLTMLDQIVVFWDESLLASTIDILSFFKLRYRTLIDLEYAENENVFLETHSTLMRPAIAKLERLLDTSGNHALSKSSRSFKAVFLPRLSLILRDLSRQFNAHPKTLISHLEFVIEELEVIVKELHKSVRKSSVSLNSIFTDVKKMRGFSVILPGLPSHVTVNGIKDSIIILPTKNRPRKLIFTCSDGRDYPYLLKCNEDFHLEERIMQFVKVVNLFLKKHDTTRNRDLGCTTYCIVPVGKSSGLIQWVDDVVPLTAIFAQSLKRMNYIEKIQSSLKHSSSENRKKSSKNAPSTSEFVSSTNDTVIKPVDQFYSKLFPHLNALGIPNTFFRSEWPLEVLKKVFSELELETQPDALAQELTFSSACTSEWHSKTRKYGRSLAVSSIVGYLLGIGDRHLDNILIDLSSGVLVHIDHSICFDLGLQLPVPEVVPFRLTQNLVRALGPGGLNGAFQINAIETLRVISNCRDPLLTLLESFEYDTLVDWTPDRAVLAEYHLELESTLRLIIDRFSSFMHNWNDFSVSSTSSLTNFSSLLHKLRSHVDHYLKARSDWKSHKQQFKALTAKISAFDTLLTDTHSENLNSRLSSVRDQRSQLQHSMGIWKEEFSSQYRTIYGSLTSFLSEDGLQYLNRKLPQPIKTFNYLFTHALEFNKVFKTSQNTLLHEWERSLSVLEKTSRSLTTYYFVLKNMPPYYLRFSVFETWIRILDALDSLSQSNPSTPDTSELPTSSSTVDQSSKFDYDLSMTLLDSLACNFYSLQEHSLEFKNFETLLEHLKSLPNSHLSQVQTHLDAILNDTMNQYSNSLSLDDQPPLEKISQTIFCKSDDNELLPLASTALYTSLKDQWIKFKSKKFNENLVFASHRALLKALQSISRKLSELEELAKSKRESNSQLQKQVNQLAQHLRNLFSAPPGLANNYSPNLQFSIIASLIKFENSLMKFDDQTNWILKIREIHSFLSLWISVLPSLEGQFNSPFADKSYIQLSFSNLQAVCVNVFDSMDYMKDHLKQQVIENFYPILEKLFQELNCYLDSQESSSITPEINSLSNLFFKVKYEFYLTEVHLTAITNETNCFVQVETQIKNSLVQVNWLWEHVLELDENSKLRSSLLTDLKEAHVVLQNVYLSLTRASNHYSSLEDQILSEGRIELTDDVYQLIKHSNPPDSVTDFKELIELRRFHTNQITDYVQTLTSLIGCIMKFELVRTQQLTEYVEIEQSVELWLSLLHAEIQINEELFPIIQNKSQYKAKKKECKLKVYQYEIEKSLDIQLLKTLEDEFNELMALLKNELQTVKTCFQTVKTNFKQVEFLVDSIIKINQKVDSESGKLLRATALKLKELYLSWVADVAFLELKVFSSLKREASQESKSKNLSTEKAEKAIEAKQRRFKFIDLAHNKELWDFVAVFNYETLIKKQLEFGKTVLELQKLSSDWLESDHNNDYNVNISREMSTATNIKSIGILKSVKHKINGTDPLLMQVTSCERRMTVDMQVDALIKVSTDRDNLARMYEGWTAWI